MYHAGRRRERQKASPRWTIGGGWEGVGGNGQGRTCTRDKRLPSALPFPLGGLRVKRGVSCLVARQCCTVTVERGAEGSGGGGKNVRLFSVPRGYESSPKRRMLQCRSDGPEGAGHPSPRNVRDGKCGSYSRCGLGIEKTTSLCTHSDIAIRSFPSLNGWKPARPPLYRWRSTDRGRRQYCTRCLSPVLSYVLRNSLVFFFFFFFFFFAACSLLFFRAENGVISTDAILPE